MRAPQPHVAWPPIMSTLVTRVRLGTVYACVCAFAFNTLKVPDNLQRQERLHDRVELAVVRRKILGREFLKKTTWTRISTTMRACVCACLVCERVCARVCVRMRTFCVRARVSVFACVRVCARACACLYIILDYAPIAKFHLADNNPSIGMFEMYSANAVVAKTTQ